MNPCNDEIENDDVVYEGLHTVKKMTYERFLESSLFEKPTHAQATGNVLVSFTYVDSRR